MTHKDRIDFAIREYPEGTRFRNTVTNEPFTSTGVYYEHVGSPDISMRVNAGEAIACCVYYKGKWAEIITENINYEIY